MTTIFDNPPPQAIDAEMSVLGSILLDNKVINIVKLLPKHFYRTSHRQIFQAMLNMDNQPIDIISLEEQLKKEKLLEEIGGSYYLTELAESVPSAANVYEHVKIVMEKYTLRQIIELAYNATKEANDLNESGAIIDSFCNKLVELSIAEVRSDHISEALHEFNDYVDRKQAGEIVDVKVPFIDNFEEGEVIVLAARPSHGKTSLATQILFECNVPAGLISMESTRKKIAGRMLAQLSRIDSKKLSRGMLEGADVASVIQASTELAEAPIYLDFASDKIYEVLATGHRWIKEHNIKLLIIDYLQLIRGGKSESKNIEIENISRSLMRFAKRTGVPLLILSQLSRDGKVKPGLEHLRGSGAIEQDADRVIFIRRLHIENVSEVIIETAKYRDGEIGEILLHFRKEMMLFNKDF